MTMNATDRHRLDGLEPDNLLAFLALLGLLRALDAADRGEDGAHLLPRAAWDLDHPPLRPVLVLPRPMTHQEVADIAARGLDSLAATHDFDGAKNVNYHREECRSILTREAGEASWASRDRVDLFTALMSDAVIKDEKGDPIQPTPLCLQFGQGHQHFLERLSEVPKQPSPPARGRGRARVEISSSECVGEALFQPWHRSDPTFGFRWDPEEDVRYALLAGDPTDSAYKKGTQHGANRLAAVGLAALTMVPMKRGGKPRALVTGGDVLRGFSFAWPIWREPATLAAIRALLAHPELRNAGALDRLSVEHVFVARRVSVGKFMNFTRARSVGRETGARDEVIDGELAQ